MFPLPSVMTNWLAVLLTYAPEMRSKRGVGGVAGFRRTYSAYHDPSDCCFAQTSTFSPATKLGGETTLPALDEDGVGIVREGIGLPDLLSVMTSVVPSPA